VRRAEAQLRVRGERDAKDPVYWGAGVGVWPPVGVPWGEDENLVPFPP
jgi:hypothetical protein